MTKVVTKTKHVRYCGYGINFELVYGEDSEENPETEHCGSVVGRVEESQYDPCPAHFSYATESEFVDVVEKAYALALQRAEAKIDDLILEKKMRDQEDEDRNKNNRYLEDNGWNGPVDPG